jgi:protein-disulfide isomerase
MNPYSGPKLVLPVGERDHIRGDIDAEITLLEYGDYECAHCQAAHPMIEALREELGPRMRFVYRNFPLTQVHPHAEMAAEAAEAAGAQDKFWEMHDTLFAGQQALTKADLVQYAASLDLDVTAFEQLLSRRAFAERIREDFLSGVRSGVNGTPTFFVDEIRYDGPPEFSSMLEAIAGLVQRRVSGR